MPFLAPIGIAIGAAASAASAAAASAAVPLALAGTAIGAGGAIYTGVAASQQANFEKKVDESNAISARNQAAAQEQRFRAQSLQKQGNVRAAYAAAGVTSEGSPLDVLGAQSMDLEQDALLIRAGGASSARNYGLQAQSAGMRSTNSLISGGIGGASSLLSGVGNTMLLSGYGGGSGMNVPVSDGWSDMGTSRR